MSYTVLARRYRSDTFDAVVGQDAVGHTLKNAIATDRVAHAYLFTGTRGVGKTTMARILAKALNCLSTDKPTATPCCRCESCVAISEGEDIDVLEIDGASNTGVEHIRELRQNAIYRPARARFKIYIIDEVHMLSVSAFNALLKTLEEPPEHVKFIFATTEANKILPTILSRCQRFDFRNIKADDIAGQLVRVLEGEQMEADEALVRRVARLARGSMRDALSLLDQLLSMGDGKLTVEMLAELLGTPRSERIIDLVGAIATGELGEALGQMDGVLSEGLALEQLAESLQGHFRDLMILRNCGEQTELVDLEAGAVRDRVIEQSKLFDDAALVYAITVMEELRRSLKGSGAGRPLVEAAVVRLTATERFSDTKALLEQLHQLQAGEAPTSRAPGRGAPPVRRETTTGTAAKGPAGAPAEKAKDQGHAGQGQEPTRRAQAVVVPENLTLGYLQDNWGAIREALGEKTGKHLQMYVQDARPVGWHGEVLTLGYRVEQNGMRSMLNDDPGRVKEIEKSLSDILEQPIKLAVTTEGKEKETAGAAGVRNKVSPGAKPSQQEINTVMKDPQIRQVQDLLGGKVRQIERLGDESSE